MKYRCLSVAWTRTQEWPTLFKKKSLHVGETGKKSPVEQRAVIVEVE